MYAGSKTMGKEQEIREILEGLINSYSLSHILGSMQDVCSNKAKHFRSLCDADYYTPDFRTEREREAFNWDAAGQHIFSVLCRIDV